MNGDAVEDIKSRLSIEDVIGRYVELKRAGRNFRGLSPFNSEKTPSFMVSPDKQIWHDFSSGKGGNMFSFIMETEGVDFRGALELLARQAGVDLSQYQRSGGQRSQQKERLYQALDLAAKFYQAHLKQNKEALEYVLKKRNFSKEVTLEFRLGYSPGDGKALTKFLLDKKFTLNELKQAGLSVQRYSETGDMFRGRVPWPGYGSTDGSVRAGDWFYGSHTQG
jgi:DNA primase